MEALRDSLTGRVAFVTGSGTGMGRSAAKILGPLTGRRPGSAGEAGELIWFLCSDYASHIIGTEVFIDGAQSLVQG